jgi:hypothetical protein
MTSAVEMAVRRLLRTEPSARTRPVGAAAARVTNGIARICRLLPLIFMTFATYNAAQPAKFVVKYVNIRQLLENTAPGQMQSRELGMQFSLKCDTTTCTGKLPLVLTQRIYYYDAVAIVLADGQKQIDVSLTLHPTNTACDPRCEEPSLNSISISIPATNGAHVTVPVTQFGDFSRAKPTDDMTDLVYRIRRDPVAHLDLSVEFE